jgi:hypothetical protein
MIVYQTDSEGYFVGTDIAYPDPLDGGYLIPAGCVTVQPPPLTEGQTIKWNGNNWLVLEPTPPEPDPEPLPTPITKETQEALRKEAYTAESDPIAMQMLRDEATKEEWLAKIEEIKARYPYPDE